MAIALDLNEKLLQRLNFARQVTGVRDGALVTRPTPPGIKEWELRDTQKHGLRLRVTAGSMTWTILKKHQGKLRRWSLDAFQRIDGDGQVFRGMTLKKAREVYDHFLSIASKGHDPVLERRALAEENKKERERVGETLEKAYIAHCDMLKDKGSQQTDLDRRKVIKWLDGSPIWKTPMVNIDQAAVAETYRPWFDHLKRGKPLPKYGPDSLSVGTLNKLVAYPSACWTACATRLELKGHSPFTLWRATVDVPLQKRRQRILDTSTDSGKLWLRELVTLRDKAHDPNLLSQRPSVTSAGLKPYSGVLIDFYLLVVLWGTRKMETALIRWEYLDMERRYLLLPGEITKSKKDGVIPITPWAHEILTERKKWNEAWRPDEIEDWVFPSREHGKPLNNPRGVLQTLQSMKGLDKIVVSAHDLRRTLATEVGEEEIDFKKIMRHYVVGQLLHHQQAHTRPLNATTGGYIIHADDARRAETMRHVYERRENRLRSLVGLPVEAGAEAPMPESGYPLDVSTVADRVKNDPAFMAQLLAAIAAQSSKK